MIAMQIQEKLGLSFQNTREANKLIDSLPAPRPSFQCEEIVVNNEVFDVYFRDVIECIRSLYGEPEFAQHFVFLPERHYSDPDCTQRLYHDMHTGKWWWAAQVRTLFPVTWVHLLTPRHCCRKLLKQRTRARPSFRSFYRPTRPS